MLYDLVCIGSGPACIFAVIELVKNGYKNILVLEQGVLRGEEPGVSLTMGFLGSGSFSDGKLNHHHAVGTSTLPEVVGLKEYYEYLDRQEQVWMDFAPTQEQINTRLKSNPNADTQISRFVPNEEAKKLRAKALANNIELSTYPVRHLGSDNAYHITLNIYKYLIDNGVTIKFGNHVDEITKNEDGTFSVASREEIDGTEYTHIAISRNVMVGVGRSGSASFTKLMAQVGIPITHGATDLGVRVEIPDEIAMKLPKAGIYEPKFLYRSRTTDDSCRTFCYSDDTEVLTQNGFKLFKDVDLEDNFLTVNPSSQNLEWVKYTHKQEVPYKGVMKHITSLIYDCLVTPDHVFAVRNNKSGYYFKAFKELNASDNFSIDCIWKANLSPSESTVDLNGFIISIEDYCELMGYFLSEGSACLRKTRRKKELTESQKFISAKPACLVSIAQAKEENLQKIIALMKRAKINYRVDNYKAVNDSKAKTLTCPRVSIIDNRIGHYLLQFGKSSQKFVPKNIKSQSSKLIQVFLDAFCLGDGTIKVSSDETERKTYYTSSKVMASDLTELIIKTGKRPHFYENDMFCITENQGLSVKFANCKVTDVDYEGKVYDVTLEKNHTLITKRNNKVWVSSNCWNPSGFVVAEKYEHSGLVTANGHSLEHTKSANSNFAVLVSKTFTTPFNDPLAYVESICKMANLLSGGGLLVQRLGDLKEGRRSTQKRIAEGSMIPTCEATPGDLSLVMPYRQLLSIMEMLETMDGVLPGMASKYTLLYGIEAKFYSNNVAIDQFAETIIPGIYVGGDGSGHSRGLNASSVMGLMVAKGLLAKHSS